VFENERRIMDLGLKGKHALVLSSSQGLGRGVAESLAAEGANVVLTARSADKLAAAVKAINAKGAGRAHSVMGDLTRDVDAIYKAASDVGNIDILVANTGGPPARMALNAKPEEWAVHFEAMVVPVFRMAGLVLPGMRERGFGRIITISSTSIVQPIPNLVISTALRSSIAGWSKTLAVEVAKEGITVNMVLPGRIHTDRTAELDLANSKLQGKTVEHITQAMLASIPANRYGRVEEFADVVCFLASQRASFVTGSMIRVDGGAVKGL
jgi:3-oxoacyl-[acyl-carrier protein] reductase